MPGPGSLAKTIIVLNFNRQTMLFGKHEEFYLQYAYFLLQSS
jgi:hypothetical protein